MESDFTEMVKTLSIAVEANKGPHSVIGTLQALLWMALDDLSDDKAEFYKTLINTIIKQQG